jgi:osomolarity two-component system, sensor histidine kinase SLN1
MLFPNLTQISQPGLNTSKVDGYSDVSTAFPDVPVTPDRLLLLGPVLVNESYALVSLTQPIMSVGDKTVVLGYLTIVAAATSLFRLQLSPEGLGDTGETLLLGPDSLWNRFNSSYSIATSNTRGNMSSLGQAPMKFVLPPLPLDGQEPRHPLPDFPSEGQGYSFPLGNFPIALRAYSYRTNTLNNASGTLDALNERGVWVSVGYARPKTLLVDWVLIVEQARSEAYAPIDTLRKILLGCVFGTIALVLILVVPCAHWSVRPIRRLKDATEASNLPPGFESDLERQRLQSDGSPDSSPTEKNSAQSFFSQIMEIGRRRLVRRRSSQVNRPRHRVFRIPARVKDKKHFVTDELTELTSTFNEMSDELYVQYTHLEERVAERTKELEISKKAAEAANESKTLFLANVSHELKTPLNGILGLCALCMGEENANTIQQSLKTMFESGRLLFLKGLSSAFELNVRIGNLLLRLLDDLLHFSRNSVSQQNIEEAPFQLGDFGNQVTALFFRVARDQKVKFSVTYDGYLPLLGDSNTGARDMDLRKVIAASHNPVGLRDLEVVGDQHRILQIILNLVSNSLKFTPGGGNVSVKVKCVGVAHPLGDGSQPTLSKSATEERRGSTIAARSSQDGSTTSRTSLKQKLGLRTKEPAAGVHSVETASTQEVRSDGPSDSSTPSSNAADSKRFLFEFAVVDTGCGIPENMQDKVFEPFVQGDPRLNKKFGGAGLGLTICQQLAGLMGGSITLTSTPGAGTSVFLHVPLK